MRRRAEGNNKRRKYKPEKESVKSKFKHVEEKLRNVKLNKKQIAVVVGFFIVLICLLVANNYTSLGLVLNKNIDSKDAIKLQLQTSIEQILPFGNEILVYSKGKIETYNNYGKSTAVIELEDTIDATISTAGEYIQIINKDKNIVWVYKNKYEVARIKLDGQIYSGTINEAGTSVIEYAAHGNKKTIGIYDNSGKIKYNIRPNNNIIGQYVLSDNSKYLAYTDVDISGISAYANVNLIDLTNVKEDESNANIIYTFDGSLAYDIYWDGREIITRFDDCYVIYNTKSKKTTDIKISNGQIVNVGDYSKRFAYTELDSKGNYLLTIRKMTSDKIKTVELTSNPKYFKYENGLIYVCYSKNIEVYNNLGMRIKSYASDMVVTEPVIFNNGRSLAMAVANKLIMFTI